MKKNICCSKKDDRSKNPGVKGTSHEDCMTVYTKNIYIYTTRYTTLKANAASPVCCDEYLYVCTQHSWLKSAVKIYMPFITPPTEQYVRIWPGCKTLRFCGNYDLCKVVCEKLS